MKNLLLVSPYVKNEALWVTGDEAEVCEVLNNFPPLGLATLAGLTPEGDYHVRIWDELVHGRITEDTVFDREYDLVGITGYGSHRRRVLALGEIFRKRGVLTAVGGPGASSEPKAYTQLFDVVFVGEVEKTWTRFLEDWERGSWESEYYQIDKPDLGESPLPVWDSIAGDMPSYGMGVIQTTRGCPYDCEFCDVIYLFGRRQRHKPIEVVLEELRRMAEFGFEWIFFCDDEFGADRKYAKALLREIIAFNAGRERPINFSTQMCVTASGDPEFCQLLADAGFDMVFIGIESASTKSLKGANKLQNLRGDLVENIHTILSYGIGIRSGMIVGFDEDDESIFDTTFEFLQRSCLPAVGIYMLMAPLGTRLWMRLMHEGRVLSLAKNKNLGPARALTNIEPKSMTRAQLYRGYKGLLQRVYSWESFAERICGFITVVDKGPLAQPTDEIYPVDAQELIDELGAGSQALAAATRILDHARSHRPRMLRRAKELIVQHARYYDTIQETIEALQNNIEREESGEIILEPFDRAAPLPIQFKQSLAGVLPGVHRRVWANLADKEMAPDTLTDVFVEFLLRLGEGFEGFEEHHGTLLEELCDRNCAAHNGVPAVDFLPVSDAQIASMDVPNIKRTRLVDDIFKSVFQRMTRIHGASSMSESAAV